MQIFHIYRGSKLGFKLKKKNILKTHSEENSLFEHFLVVFFFLLLRFFFVILSKSFHGRGVQI